MSANDKKRLSCDNGDDPRLPLQYNVSPSTCGIVGNPRQPAVALKPMQRASTITESATTIIGDLTPPPVIAANQPSTFSSTNAIVNGTSHASTDNNSFLDKGGFESWIEHHYLERNFVNWNIVFDLYKKHRQHKRYFKGYFNGQEYSKGWECDYDESFFTLMDHLNLDITTINAGSEIMYHVHQSSSNLSDDI